MKNPIGSTIKLENVPDATGQVIDAYQVADSEHWLLTVKWDDGHACTAIHSADLRNGELIPA